MIDFKYQQVLCVIYWMWGAGVGDNVLPKLQCSQCTVRTSVIRFFARLCTSKTSKSNLQSLMFRAPFIHEWLKSTCVKNGAQFDSRETYQAPDIVWIDNDWQIDTNTMVPFRTVPYHHNINVLFCGEVEKNSKTCWRGLEFANWNWLLGAQAKPVPR